MQKNYEMNDNQNNDSQNDGGDITKSSIVQCGSVRTKSPRGNIHCLNIIGQIEGHMILPPQDKTTKYEHVIPQLVSVEEDNEVDGLLILLNTVGGDVEAGLAIAELVAGMKKPTVSLVLGGGHSIGVPLAVSSDYSFIAPSATMTIHPMRVNGLVIGVAQTFDYMQKMQDRIINFITAHSKIDYPTFRKLMLETGEIANDVGTILFGEKAVECGLIDGVGTLSDALEKLYCMIDKKRKEK